MMLFVDVNLVLGCFICGSEMLILRCNHATVAMRTRSWVLNTCFFGAATMVLYTLLMFVNAAETLHMSCVELFLLTRI